MVRLHHSVIEEAADNEEIVPTASDRSRLIALIDVEAFAPCDSVDG